MNGLKVTVQFSPGNYIKYCTLNQHLLQGKCVSLNKFKTIAGKLEHILLDEKSFHAIEYDYPRRFEFYCVYLGSMAMTQGLAMIGSMLVKNINVHPAVRPGSTNMHYIHRCMYTVYRRDMVQLHVYTKLHHVLIGMMSKYLGESYVTRKHTRHHDNQQYRTYGCRFKFFGTRISEHTTALFIRCHVF